MIMSKSVQALLTVVVLLGMPNMAIAQQQPAGVSEQEQAACRPDAIRLCFFSLATSDGLRACLRRNKPSLSPPCKKLIESRGN
jgi:hypothetical protein